MVQTILLQKKIKFEYNDPYFPKLHKVRKLNFVKKSILINKNNLKKFTAVLLVTDHDSYDYKFIASNSKTVFDTRSRYKQYNYNNIIYC